MDLEESFWPNSFVASSSTRDFFFARSDDTSEKLHFQCEFGIMAYWKENVGIPKLRDQILFFWEGVIQRSRMEMGGRPSNVEKEIFQPDMLTGLFEKKKNVSKVNRSNFCGQYRFYCQEGERYAGLTFPPENPINYSLRDPVTM